MDVDHLGPLWERHGNYNLFEYSVYINISTMAAIVILAVGLPFLTAATSVQDADRAEPPPNSPPDPRRDNEQPISVVMP